MRVTSARNERIQRVRRLCRDASLRRAEKACVVEGVRVASEYVRGAGAVELALIAPRLLELEGGPALRDEILAALPDESVLETSDEILESVADTRTPQGVLLVVPRPLHEGLPPGDGRPVLVAWEMQDPGNVGTIVRIAEGAGCAAAVVARAPGGAAADPFSPRALRAAAGSAFRLAVHEWAGTPADLARALRDEGFRMAACVARGGSPPDESDLGGNVAILIGSEGHGLPEELSSPPASRLTIPLEGAAESLNAAAAAAVIAFEAARRRRA